MSVQPELSLTEKQLIQIGSNIVADQELSFLQSKYNTLNRD